jgi:AcrR family transcriptional regulator
MNPDTPARPYHHGDLAAALRRAAREILEGQGLEALSLRSVARKAGVSHAAPYRHFESREKLLAELAIDGFHELKDDIVKAASLPGLVPDRIGHIGAAYARFAAKHGPLLKLMFGPDFPNRAQMPELQRATEAIGEEIGAALGNPALGLAVWAAVHGIAILALDDIIDLGQRQGSMSVLPSRTEILLRSLFSQPL